MLTTRAPAEAINAFHAINVILDLDPLIDEMGWLPSLDAISQDLNNLVKDPWKSSFYVALHKLAIHKNMLAGLLHAATQFFIAQQPLFEILKCTSEKLSSEELKQIYNSTRILTLLNPHHYTAWNIRKLLIEMPSDSPTLLRDSERQAKKLDRISQEFAQIELALSKQPKSGEAWAHRKWLLRCLHRISQVDILREIKLCESASNNHKRNFYAWTHRIYVVQNWMDDSQESLLSEFDRIWYWLSTHLSDASAAHHCSILLRHLRRASEQGQLPIRVGTISEVSNLDFTMDNAMPKLTQVASESALKSAPSSTESMKEPLSIVNLMECLLIHCFKFLQIYRAGETWWYFWRSLLTEMIDMASETAGPQGRISEEGMVHLLQGSGLPIHQPQDELANRFLAWILRHLQFRMKGHHQQLPEALELSLVDAEIKLREFNWKPSLFDLS